MAKSHIQLVWLVTKHGV